MNQIIIRVAKIKKYIARAINKLVKECYKEINLREKY